MNGITRQKITDLWSAGYVGEGGGPQPGMPQPWLSTEDFSLSNDASFAEQEVASQLDAELNFQMQQRTKFRQQFKKTQYCRYHFSNGCRKGAICEFAHARQELTVSPDLRRTSICKDWLEGKCLSTADTCEFAHGSALLRRTIDGDAMPGAMSSAPSSKFASVPASGVNGGKGQLTRISSAWEQRLLQQQVEQEQMKQTIREQQKVIDALVSMHASKPRTQENRTAVPQNVSQILPGSYQPFQNQQFLPQYSKSVPPNSQGLQELEFYGESKDQFAFYI